MINQRLTLIWVLVGWFVLSASFAEADSSSMEQRVGLGPAGNDLPKRSTHWEKGKYYHSRITENSAGDLHDITYYFHDFNSRALWCLFLVDLGEPVDLSQGGQLVLHFSEISSDVTLKFELRDQDSPNVIFRSATWQQAIPAGKSCRVLLGGHNLGDGLTPLGWWRRALWPKWERIQHVAIIVENRFTQTQSGNFKLTRIQYQSPIGTRRNLKINSKLIRYDEYAPARGFQKHSGLKGYFEQKKQPSSLPKHTEDESKRDTPVQEPSQNNSLGGAGKAPVKKKNQAGGSIKSRVKEQQVEAKGLPEPAGVQGGRNTRPLVDKQPNLRPVAPVVGRKQASLFAPAEERLEVTQGIKRDDPATALFVSGAGYKIDLFDNSPLGVSGSTSYTEETNRVDGLLINNIRKHFSDPAFDPNTMLTDPVEVASYGVSAIFDIPGRADLPRFKYTYEDTEVDSRSSILLDFRVQVHEVTMLWTTPYLDNDRRFRLTFEPLYQFWQVTSTDTSLYSDVRRDVHRAGMSVVVHDKHEQREFFFQGIVGVSDYRENPTDETSWSARAEWRQWYGTTQTAFSTVGIVYDINQTDPNNPVFPLLTENATRDFQLFANLITEIGERGRWRWFNEIEFHRVDTDIFLSTGVVSTNRVFNFVQLESRITYEVITNVDLSLGVEHTVADTHTFDSLGLVGRLAVFNFGPFRGEIGARRTWYYNVQDNDGLTSFFIQMKFAQ